ncbi:MAG: DUF1501 domain-containing protein [Pirellulales bacterium]
MEAWQQRQARRAFFREAFCGFGSLAIGTLAARESRAAGPRPLAPRAAPRPSQARSVIFLFMAGGPSHLETFDPKPLLNQLDGQPRPAEFGEAKYQFVRPDARLLGSRRTFRRYGEAGIEVSDLFPRLARQIDDVAVIRSCHGDKVVHSAAQYELFSGRTVPGFPSMGAWTVYGLGCESDSLPAYVVMPDPVGALEAGQPMYNQGFLPALYQPTMLRSGAQPVRNLARPPHVSASERAATVELIRQLNEQSLTPGDDEWQARLAAYELAFKMQLEGPEAFDLSRESRATHDLYGIGVPETDDYGRRCLLARRLVERGVRFQVVVSGGGAATTQWDAHADIEENHRRMAGRTDGPIAGLLADLKQRGLLDSTLVLWGGEFGRSPEAESRRGRDHHNVGFTMWLAGGGVRGGQVIGATDAIGLRAVERPCHFRDLHATLLQLLGFEQNELTFPHLGRDERLTLIEGQVIQELIG